MRSSGINSVHRACTEIYGASIYGNFKTFLHGFDSRLLQIQGIAVNIGNPLFYLEMQHSIRWYPKILPTQLNRGTVLFKAGNLI